ncbi:hypothetical protein KAT21_03340 [Candidatus Bathyarchaeota archaeon]|nr:hypothetical protein [Candidatus Bathyarchaeota archaeon]
MTQAHEKQYTKPAVKAVAAEGVTHIFSAIKIVEKALFKVICSCADNLFVKRDSRIIGDC